MAQSFSGRLPNLRVIRKENGGVSSARNAGIRAAKGTLIALFDADDLWHPTFLEKMSRRLEDRPECAFVYCFLRKVNEQSQVIRREVPYGADGWGFYQMMARNYVGSGSNSVYRRDAMVAAGLYEPTLDGCEDFYLQAIVLWSAPVTHVPEYLVGYRSTEGSLSKNFFSVVKADKIMMRWLRERLPGIRGAGWRWMVAGRVYKELAAYRKAKDEGLRTRWLQLRAVAFDPWRYLEPELRYMGWIRKREPLERHPLKGSPFFDLDPKTELMGREPAIWERRMADARRLDAEHGKMQAKARAQGT